MVFDTVVRLPRNFLGNQCPLVTYLIVKLDEHQLFFESPVQFGCVSVDVVFIAE